MKKLLTTLALAICCAMAMTSCDGLNNNNNDDWVYYTVNPDGEFSGTSALAVKGQMFSAIVNANLTNDVGLGRRNDSAKVIQICDGVYNDTKATAVGTFTIVVTLSDFNGQSTTLKSYKYN